jgi:hypothetical protein
MLRSVLSEYYVTLDCSYLPYVLMSRPIGSGPLSCLQGRHKMQRAEDGKEAPHLWPLLLRQHASVLLSSVFLQGDTLRFCSELCSWGFLGWNHRN